MLQPHPLPSFAASPRSIDSALFPATDFWHATPGLAHVPPGFKEWSHFSVLAPDFDLLVNFSLTTGFRARESASPIPRVTVLFRDSDGSWDGDVESFSLEQTRISEGLPDVTLGCNSARFADHRYRVDVALAARDLAVKLDLHPITHPLVANNIRLSNSESFRWMVVPHLSAHGEVTASGRHYTITAVPAYHDRNSGCFAWGGDFSWEWATILPTDAAQPWSLSYSRIANRERGITLSQSLILWRRASLSRKFYGRDLSISGRSVLRHERVLRLPRVAALLMPGTAADVPRQMLVEARAYGDAVTLQMWFDDFAQIVIPNDEWPGLTMLCEIRGRAEVTGRIGDEPIAFDGRVQVELNHACG